jgi:hypothetical protein
MPRLRVLPEGASLEVHAASECVNQSHGEPDESFTQEVNATEMVSIWLAHNAPHIAIHLGMWHEAGADERETWGYLLADVVRHVSQGWRSNVAGNPATRRDESLIRFAATHRMIEGQLRDSLPKPVTLMPPLWQCRVQRIVVVDAESNEGTHHGITRSLFRAA